MMRNRAILGGGSMLNMVSPINWLHPLNKGLVARWDCVPGLTGGSRLVNLTRAGDKDGNHGTLTNGPTWTGAAGRPGGFGALRFASSGAIVSVANSAQLQFSASDFTLRAWVRIDSLTNQYQGIIVKNPGAQTEYGFAINSGGAAARIYTNRIATGDEFIGGTTLTTGRWYDIVIVRGATADYYLDGRLEASKALASAPTDSTNAIELGTGAGGFSDFTGSLDGVQIFNRALSASEVATLYEDSRRGSPDTLNWISTRTYFLADAADSSSPPEVPYVLRGGGIAEIAFPAWQQSFRFR